MEYIVADFKITCPTHLLQVARDILANATADAGFESFEDTPGGLKGYAQKENFDHDKLIQTLHDFLLEDTSISFSLSEAENKDWNEAWEEAGFAPVCIGDRITILDARQGRQTTPPTHIPIYIYARQAFGTGTHPTTRMIVSTLLDLPLQAKHILDCGCGSGILSIAASKLGAAEVVGYDIDEWSVDNTRHNAETNHATNISVLHGNASVLEHLKTSFDIIMANINRNILIQDMAAFTAMMNPGAKLVISGFYEQDIPKLLETAKRLKLYEEKRMIQDEWACLLLGQE